MDTNKKAEYKTVLEISSLSSMLTPANQAFVLNTINTLLFSQQVSLEQPHKPPENKTA